MEIKGSKYRGPVTSIIQSSYKIETVFFCVEFQRYTILSFPSENSQIQL